MERFNPRLGALLQSYSTRPEVAQAGSLQLQQMDDQEKAEAESVQKATEVKQGVFAKLLQTAIENGADESTLQRLGMAAGIDTQGMGLSTIGNDPTQKRAEQAARFAKDYDPASVDAWVSSGRYADLKRLPDANKNKNAVLSYGAQLVDPSGTVLAENKNRPPVRETQAGYKQQVRAAVMERNEELRTKIGTSTKLSDRLALARAKIDENVAGGISTPTTGDKLKGELDKRREALIKYDNAAESVAEILEKNPTAATIGADVAKSVVSMAANAQGLLNLIPGVDIKDLDLKETDWSDKLNSYAGDNAELRTTMFHLAIQLAVADGLAGGRMSNQQISMALDNIGAGGRSPRAIRRKLQEVRQRVAESLDIALDGALEDFSDLDRPAPITPAEPAEIQSIEAEMRRRGLK